MAFTKQRFALFFSLPLDNQDWANLAASHVKLAMLMLPFADAATLRRMRDMGIRVVLRVPEESYYEDTAPFRIKSEVMTAMQSCPVEAVLVGNEPDAAQDLGYGSPSFGQPFAYVHRRRFDAVRVALQGVGIKVISPALIMRSISEDEAPAPGQVTWREILCLPDTQGKYGYLEADGNGVHIYGYGWDGPVDELRYKFALKIAATLWHKELWIDEVGMTGKYTQVEKIAAYIDMTEILLSVQNNGKQHPLGQRVNLLCPFVSNGTPGDPPAWSPGFLIRDPAAYALLGNWMRR